MTATDYGRGVPMWLQAPPDAARLRAACAELDPVIRIRSSPMPSAEEARGLAICMLDSGDAAEAERGRCWLWVAAASGSKAAASELARVIAERAQHDPSNLPAPKIMALLRAWLSVAEAPRGMISAHVDEEEAEPWDTAPSGFFVAIPSLGDPGSREGKEIGKRLSHVIGVPLALKGKIPPPGAVEAGFKATFPWAARLGRYLEGQMALLRASGNATPRLPSQLLVGPPGCGKTTMLEWLADLCGLPSLTISIGGTSDSAGLTAVSRGWLTAQPCAPVNAIVEFMCANPAIILDEIDKGVADIANRNGSVSGALLGMLKPPADGYRDSFLMANVDFKHVSFMASANSLTSIPEPLRSRFVIHPVQSPGPEHFGIILPRVIANEAKRLGVDEAMLPWIGPAERKWLETVYSASRCSIRSLEQAFQLLLGERAADEALAMQRPH